MTDVPAPRATRDGALALVAAGNTLESVAHVYGVPVGTLRGWIAQPGDALPGDAAPASVPARAWLHFPGTVVFWSGSNWAIIAAALVAVLVSVPLAGWHLVFDGHARPGVVAACALAALACAAAAVQAILAARANRFEMRPDAIARFTLAGCTVLPYADIVGLIASRGKGYWFVQFLTRTGVTLSIHPTFEQLEDERLWAWLRTIPRREGGPMTRLPDD